MEDGTLKSLLRKTFSPVNPTLDIKTIEEMLLALLIAKFYCNIQKQMWTDRIFYFFLSEHKHESQTFLNDPGFLKISLYHICFY